MDPPNSKGWEFVPGSSQAVPAAASAALKTPAAESVEADSLAALSSHHGCCPAVSLGIASKFPEEAPVQGGFLADLVSSTDSLALAKASHAALWRLRALECAWTGLWNEVVRIPNYLLRSLWGQPQWLDAVASIAPKNANGALYYDLSILVGSTLGGAIGYAGTVPQLLKYTPMGASNWPFLPGGAELSAGGVPTSDTWPIAVAQAYMASFDAKVCPLSAYRVLTANSQHNWRSPAVYAQSSAPAGGGWENTRKYVGVELDDAEVPTYEFIPQSYVASEPFAKLAPAQQRALLDLTRRLTEFAIGYNPKTHAIELYGDIAFKASALIAPTTGTLLATPVVAAGLTSTSTSIVAPFYGIGRAANAMLARYAAFLTAPHPAGFPWPWWRPSRMSDLVAARAVVDIVDPLVRAELVAALASAEALGSPAGFAKIFRTHLVTAYLTFRRLVAKRIGHGTLGGGELELLAPLLREWSFFEWFVIAAKLSGLSGQALADLLGPVDKHKKAGPPGVGRGWDLPRRQHIFATATSPAAWAQAVLAEPELTFL